MGNLEACGSLPYMSNSKGTTPDGSVTYLRMGMTPEQVILAWSDTPCKVPTQYHGNPSEAWGYQVRGDPPSFPPKAAPCDQANYWVYYEKQRLVGWTPPR